MNRLQTLYQQVKPEGPGQQGDQDVLICCAVRTAITKSRIGGLKDLFPEDMLAPLFKEVCRRTGIKPSNIEDVCIGNTLQPGAGALSSRIATILGGLPVTTSSHTVNRQCSSGLQAVANIAASIKVGNISVGLGGGVESMTQFDMTAVLNPEKMSSAVFENDAASDCLIPMGLTSENVTEKFGITRQQLDAFAADSQVKAAAAQKQGLFRQEIVPVNLYKYVDDPNGEETRKVIDKVVSEDGGIRPTTTSVSLSKLKPSFRKDGSTTAGNSSQVADGAAVVLLASREAAERLGLPILARFVSFAVAGVPPEIMGIGPKFAIPLALQHANISLHDVDIVELNEAFASQALYCATELNIPPHKLNPKGGAIALGHPLGATGARQIATLLPELRRIGGRYGVVSMCIGTGMGAAAVIENLQTA